jgi:hypothetical protein
MKIKTGATGRLIEGHVLDVAKTPFEEKLRDYDSLLYVKWNAAKYKGWGCWEVRRRPATKQIVDYAEYESNLYLRLEYREVDFVNHVLDAPYLNYQIIEKIQSMDTWKQGHWIRDIDYTEAKFNEEHEAKVKREMTYSMKQHKKELRDFREYILSGHNPYRIAEAWGSKKSSS